MKAVYTVLGLIVVIAAVSSFFVLTKGDSQRAAGNAEDPVRPRNINPSELEQMMQNKDFKLINVHIPYAGDIEGTDLSIPYNEIADKINLQKDEKIVLYCRSGSMSRIAAEKLLEIGYTDVYDLQGGMNGWQQAGNGLTGKNNV